MMKLNKGTIKTKQGKLQKHVSQMTPVERVFLKKTVQQLNRNYSLSAHASEKIEEGSVKFSWSNLILTVNDFMNCLIEFKTSNFGDTVLLRGSTPLDAYLDGKMVKLVQCVSIDIKTGTIVTVYNNLWNDNHDTIDMRRYQKKLKIIK